MSVLKFISKKCNEGIVVSKKMLKINGWPLTIEQWRPNGILWLPSGDILAWGA